MFGCTGMSVQLSYKLLSRLFCICSFVVGVHCNCHHFLGVHDHGWLPHFTEAYTRFFKSEDEWEWNRMRLTVLQVHISGWHFTAFTFPLCWQIDICSPVVGSEEKHLMQHSLWHQQQSAKQFSRRLSLYQHVQLLAVCSRQLTAAISVTCMLWQSGKHWMFVVFTLNILVDTISLWIGW